MREHVGVSMGHCLEARRYGIAGPLCPACQLVRNAVEMFGREEFAELERRRRAVVERLALQALARHGAAR